MPVSSNRIVLIYCDGGGGHRSAALALREALGSNSNWEVRLLSLQQVLKPIDIVHKVVGIPLEDFYNSLTRKGLTAAVSILLPLLRRIIRIYRQQNTGLLARIARLQAVCQKLSSDVVKQRTVGENFRMASIYRVHRLPLEVISHAVWLFDIGSQRASATSKTCSPSGAPSSPREPSANSPWPSTRQPTVSSDTVGIFSELAITISFEIASSTSGVGRPLPAERLARRDPRVLHQPIRQYHHPSPESLRS